MRTHPLPRSWARPVNLRTPVVGAVLLVLLLLLGQGRPLPLVEPQQKLSLRQVLAHLEPSRREAVVQEFLALKASAEILTGRPGAQAVGRLLRLELYNQSYGRPSAFDDPEGALAASRRWLEVLGALKRGQPPDTRDLPLALQHVLPHREAIRRAAQGLHFPSGVLAAIVDNEQYGGDKALGLSRGIRSLADGLAESLSESTGSAGLLARTLGLAQMSWEDALKQQPRLARFAAWPYPTFPQTELEARQALEDPAANLLLTASRLRGYFNAALGLPRDHTRYLAGHWLYYLGPAWHNWPTGAQQQATWPYAFHGFFKGLFYQALFATR
ncbi:hypothetical protein [Calidithermus chliarophilus]|uniref:hypothetical protein n=1 Tax=Calidithermus chliarophilus TaxID=52023 RepID=UPI0004819B11|nr:hypothetical protein [Calidithermus chliarophilus]